jgi:quercetin dioxygenase-like cupin family protein
MVRKTSVLVGLLVLGLLVPASGRPGVAAPVHEVAEKTLLDNDRVLVVEYVFPPGFKGEEHEAPVNEFAYVLEGQFSVVTKGKGTAVVKKGEIEYAPKGTIHYSINDTKRPARVLVVLLKER